MINKIKNKINENNALLAQAYSKVAEHMGGADDTELKEIAALLKINEIILMELNEKQHFVNEENVLKSLVDMNKIIMATIISLE
jgi:hypothetical protein